MTPHALTKQSPAELMLGRKIRGPLDTLPLQTVLKSRKVQEKNENECLRADIQRKQEKVKSYVDKKRSAGMSSFETEIGLGSSDLKLVTSYNHNFQEQGKFGRRSRTTPTC